MSFAAVGVAARLYAVNSAFVAGLLLGGFVAAQVGPVSLLCIRTSTRAGFRVGVSVGLGAAVIDLAYAICGVAGAAAIVQIKPVQFVLGLAGTAVLVIMAVRTLRTAWRLRLGGETSDEVAQPRHAFRTGLVATASNPLTIVSWAAIFGAAHAGSVADTGTSTVALLAGIAIGSATWFVVLAAVSAAVGSRFGPKTLATIDGIAGLGLLFFAVVLGVRTVREA